MKLSNLPRDPDEMNDKRASAARRALLFFARDFGETDDEGEISTFAQQNISDLIADLAHLCDRQGIEILRCFSNARSNYSEETENSGGQFVD